MRVCPMFILKPVEDERLNADERLGGDSADGDPIGLRNTTK